MIDSLTVKEYPADIQGSQECVVCALKIMSNGKGLLYFHVILCIICMRNVEESGLKDIIHVLFVVLKSLEYKSNRKGGDLI